MKKICRIILFIIFVLLLSSCKKEEYEVIEVSSYDLHQAIQDNETNFVFAIYNEKYSNYQAFLSDLQRVADRGKTNIYYVDYGHVSGDAANTFVFEVGYDSGSGQYFGVYENGVINHSGYYSDFDSMFKELYQSRYTKPIKITSEEEQREYINQALEMYKDSKYNAASDLLDHAWPNDEAKKLFKTMPYLHLTHIWESYDFTDKTYTKVNYLIFYFLTDNDEYCLYYQSKNQVYDGFQKPSLTDLSHRYYYIDGDIIYMSSKEDGSYEKYYRIISINEMEMKLEDLKNKNKVLNFQRRE